MKKVLLEPFLQTQKNQQAEADMFFAHPVVLSNEMQLLK